MSLEQQIKEYQEKFTACGGLVGGGITRLLYTDEWLQAVKLLQSEMQKVGMVTRFDEVGNLFGRYEGSAENPKVISAGSHIDTVVEGGEYDGQFGIVAALIAMQNLVAEHGQPKNTLQLISLAEEEGSRFPTVFWGSKNLWGHAKPSDVADIADDQGKKFVDEMRRVGFEFKPENQPEKMDYFLELHIEQGNFLENRHKSIGVITSITGQKRYSVSLTGEANHAGTTRMEYRRDTAYAYATIVTKAIDLAKSIDDILVCTFGKVQLTPNTVNVVPGEATFSIDCRHPDASVLNSYASQLETLMQEICREQNIDLEFECWMDQAPVPMNQQIIDLFTEVVEELGCPYQVMHSGAGHDSQIFALEVPTGMIFIPSVKGISHNVAEFTHLSDLVNGVKVLQRALYKLAY